MLFYLNFMLENFFFALEKSLNFVCLKLYEPCQWHMKFEKFRTFSVCFKQLGQEVFVLNLAKRWAQLVEHQALVQEVVGLNPDWTNIQGLLITGGGGNVNALFIVEVNLAIKLVHRHSTF